MNNDNFQYYENSGYKNLRNRKRTLILDVDDSTAGDTHLGSGGEFNIKLSDQIPEDYHIESIANSNLESLSKIASPDISPIIAKPPIIIKA